MSLATWREEIGRHIVHLDFEPLNDSPFQATLRTIFQENGLRVARAANSAGTTFRDRALTKMGDPSYDLLIARTSGCEVSHDGREHRLRRGDGIVLRNWEPGRLSGTSSVSYVALVLPAARVESAGRAQPWVGRILRREEPAVALLDGYVRLLEAQAHWGSDLAPGIDGHIFDLALASASAAERSHVQEAARTARTAQIIAFIEANHADPDLSPSKAASAFGISPRYLERLMELSGKTFSARVLELRLNAAFARLTTPDASGTRISDIALQSGFCDVSYFNRKFRARYGLTPRGARG